MSDRDLTVFTQGIIDISWPVDEKTTTWKDSNDTRFEEKRNWSEHHCRNSNIHMNAHTGTHIDAGCHFLKDGNTIDEIPLDRLQGPCKILDFSALGDSVPQITREHFSPFESCIDKDDIILLKTRNSQLAYDASFNPHYLALGGDAAQWLVEKGIKCIGIDFPGIERSDIQKDHQTHQVLLSAKIPIIEGLRLAEVQADFVFMHQSGKKAGQKSKYFFLCLPIKLMGIDAAPARALLYKL